METLNRFSVTAASAGVLNQKRVNPCRRFPRCYRPCGPSYPATTAPSTGTGTCDSAKVRPPPRSWSSKSSPSTVTPRWPSRTWCAITTGVTGRTRCRGESHIAHGAMGNGLHSSRRAPSSSSR
uniref:(northern house mosquito) hypothetical protein n=1 Tax=Culex pipiens TaxID=7175 RepID=A0A8D8IZG4_CULPI